MPPGNRITLKAATMPSPSNLASSPLTDTTIWTRDGLRIHTHAPLLAAIRSGAILRQYTRWFSTGPSHIPYRKEKYLPSQQEAVSKEALVGCNLFFYLFWNWKLGKTVKKHPLCFKSTCVWLLTKYWLIIVIIIIYNHIGLIIVFPQPYTEESFLESWKSLWTRGGVHTASSRLQ